MTTYSDTEFTDVSRYIPDLDVEKAAKLLDVKPQARMNAALENQPKTTDRDLDGAQRGIVEYCSMMLTQLGDTTSLRINDFLRGCYDVDIAGRRKSIDNLRIKAGERIQRHLSDARQPLRQAYMTAFQRGRAYRAFRTEHAIEREPVIKDGHSGDIASLAFVFAAETAVNLFMFVLGARLNFGEALIQGPLISIINIAVAFAIGFWLLRQRLIGSAAKRWSFTGFAIAMIFAIVVFNMAVGGYRLIAGFPFSAFQDLGSLTSLWALLQESFNFVNQSTGYNAVNALLVSAIGLAGAIFAMLKGYNWIDPIPGYEQVARNKQDAEDEVLDIKDSLLDQISETTDEIHREAEQRVQEADQAMDRFDWQMHQIRREDQYYFEYAARIEATCNQLLRIYRDANMAVRDTPAPDYFSAWRTLKRKHDKTALEDLQRQQAGHREQLHSLAQDAIDLNEEIRRLHNRGHDLADRLFESIKNEVRLEASRRGGAIGQKIDEPVYEALEPSQNSAIAALSDDLPNPEKSNLTLESDRASDPSGATAGGAQNQAARQDTDPAPAPKG
jgi:hypothetical protein